MSNQDTRALVLIKGVVDDCSLDVVESMRQIREIVGTDSNGRRLIAVNYHPPVYKRHESGSIEMWASPLYVYLYDDGAAIQYSEGIWGRLPVPPAEIFGDIPQDEPAVDPIAEIEERGAVLRIDWDTSRIVWAMDSDGMREPIATHMSDGSARLVHLRAAAARLLERVRRGNS